MNILELRKRKKELKKELEKINKSEKLVKNKEIIENMGKNGRNHVNELIRVSINFDNEIMDIQKKRIENGMDEALISKPKVTELIIKHINWNKIKQDVIAYNFNAEEQQNVN